MLRPDPHSVRALLADSETVARETLADPNPDHAAPTLRSWAPVAHAAAHLRAALPIPPGASAGSVDAMARIAIDAAGVQRSVTGSRWPGPARSTRGSP